jgi:hypothetical protein
VKTPQEFRGQSFFCRRTLNHQEDREEVVLSQMSKSFSLPFGKRGKPAPFQPEEDRQEVGLLEPQ